MDRLVGHNRITSQALTSIAQASAAEYFDVGPADVRVSWSDDGGLLALSLALPIGVPPLTAVVRDPQRVAASGGPIWDRAVAGRAAILARVSELSGSTLGRVDIRMTGTRHSVAGRVQ
ncbi:hypothetical protein IV498_09160 [Paenarthrobacter sp. Z7-10]|uniref:hypothetical protein n=1 Tax=Paenarthrobacter sp. Z7-10 TaxID=2787635 RepID=UPI0022A9415F|nr:hypothetical protein [Paenarthrobacter sp. Z7-10]MCZ2403347.1 hypothetical protein [Paenarthrobacter sp. Z7-10]